MKVKTMHESQKQLPLDESAPAPAIDGLLTETVRNIFDGSLMFESSNLPSLLALAEHDPTSFGRKFMIQARRMFLGETPAQALVARPALHPVLDRLFRSGVDASDKAYFPHESVFQSWHCLGSPDLMRSALDSCSEAGRNELMKNGCSLLVRQIELLAAKLRGIGASVHRASVADIIACIHETLNRGADVSNSVDTKGLEVSVLGPIALVNWMVPVDERKAVLDLVTRLHSMGADIDAFADQSSGTVFVDGRKVLNLSPVLAAAAVDCGNLEMFEHLVQLGANVEDSWVSQAHRGETNLMPILQLAETLEFEGAVPRVAEAMMRGKIAEELGAQDRLQLTSGRERRPVL